MAGSIGVVRQVVGEVFAVAADGSRRPLSEGDRVFAGEQLVTGAQGAVAVALANGQELVLGRESSLPLNPSLLASAPDAGQPAAEQAAATPTQQDLTDVEKLQAAIEAGVDPTQAAEATAAGPGSGGGGSGNAGGGHSFVLLSEVGGALDPSIGFPTAGFGGAPEFPNPEIFLATPVVPAVGETPPPPPPPVDENGPPTVEVDFPEVEGGQAQVFERGLPAGSQSGDGSTVVNGSFRVADPDGLADLKSLTVGSLNLNLTTSGFAGLVGQSFATAHGTVLITGYSNGTYSFSYTLTESTTDTADPETDGFLINVSDGLASASATVTIEIIDDLPQARADNATVSEGGSVNGNVVTGAGSGSVADLFGADGRPSPTTGVVGVRAGDDVSTPASSGVGASISTALGTLVLNADGSYTYTSHADSLGESGAVDTFTYSIVDADGDISTTTLTIDVSAITVIGGVQAGSDDEVREAALDVIGSEPGSNDEFASGTLVGSGGNGPYAFSLGVGAGVGQYGQLVVGPTGAYTYTLTSAPKVNPGDNGNNLQFTETFTFQVVDADGNTGFGTLTIDIIDDVPSVSVKGLGELELQVDETHLGSVASENFAGAFLPVFGADDAALANAVTYSLDVKSPGADSGLRDTETGNGILLYREGSDVVGRVIGGGQVAFRLSVAADGTVTLVQSRAIFHSPDSGPDQVAGLAGADLVTLSATVTDGDGDRDTASLDLGSAISFRDDAPCIDPHVKVSLDDDSLYGGNPGGVNDNHPDTRNTSGTIAHDFGADGPGTIELQDSGAPHGFTYVETKNGLLIKQGEVTVITITLDKFTGAYTVTQNAPILHPYGDDENNLTFEVEYKITDKDGDRADGSLYIKVDDDTPKAFADNRYLTEDGTPDSVSGNVLDNDAGGADQPKAFSSWNGVTGAVPGDNGSLLVNTAYGLVTLNANGSYSFTLANGSAAVDGLDHGQVVTLQYAYTMRDADNDPSSSTLSIIITGSNDVPTVVVSTPNAEGDMAKVYEKGLTSPADTSETTTGSFTVGDSDGLGNLKTLTVGSITVDLASQGFDSLVDQSFTTAHGTVTITGYSNGTYSFSYTLAGPTTDVAGVAETDGFEVSVDDGMDTASADVLIEIIDDVPKAYANDAVQLDDDALPGGNPGGTGDADPDTANLTGTLGHNFGADGAGSINLLTSGAPSGFEYVKDGDNLLIQQGGFTVITVTLNAATGAYSVVQNAAIQHPEGYNENDVSFSVGYTVTDKDGDSAPGSLTIHADDDTPTVSCNEAVQLDDDALYGGNPDGTGDVNPNTANLTGTLGHSFGADGPGSISLLTGGAPAGFSYEKDGDKLLIKQSGVTVITLTLNWATGAYSVVQNAALQHPLGDDENDLSFTVGYKVTDADGDSVQGSLTIHVNDDTPTVTANAPVQLDDDALYGGNPGGTDDVDPNTANLTGTLGHSFGADGPGSISLLADGAPDGFEYVKVGNDLLIKQGGQTVITLKLDPSSGAYQVIQNKPILHPDGQDENDVSFTINYKVSDKDGDSATGSLTINVDDDTPQAKNDSATVSEARTEDFNVVFVLDFSGSIDNGELNQMLTAVRAAGQALFNGANGDVKVQIVAFSGTATSYSVSSDFTSFSNLIKTLNPTEGGMRPFNGQTDFTAAIQEVMSDYQPLAGYKNQVFFISDGNPNEQTGNNGNSLTGTTASDWSSFIGTHGLNVTAIGIGDNISMPRLQDVDLDGSGTPIVVSGFNSLITTLLGQVSNGLVSGNVLLGNDGASGGGDDDSFGADGAGAIKSILINGTLHTWNGDPASAQLSNVVTGAGGKLSFNFATGAWSYQAPSGLSGDVQEQFTYTLVDADNDPSSAVLSITVKALDDAPLAKDDHLGTAEDQPLTITAAQLFGADGTGPQNDSDADSSSFTSIRITQLASNGVLKLDGVAVTPNQVISLALINDGKLVFVPDANENGDPYATFKYQVSDGTSYSNVATVTIDVTPVNDAPVARDDSFTTQEDTAVTISYNGLFGSDGTGGNNDYDIDSAAFTTIRITALPDEGILQLNGVPVELGDEISVADINAGKLKFVPDADENGNPYASFKYQVSDGSLYSNEATVTIKVDAVNDKPQLDLDANDSSGATGANYQTSFTEGGPAVAIADLDTRVTDIDDSHIESATIVLTNAKAGDSLSFGGLPSGINGSVTSSAGKITVTLSGSATKADYETAIESIRFSNSSTNPNTTPRSLTVVVNDGNVDSNVAQTTINLIAVDNAPDAKDDQATVTEGQGQDFNLVFVLDFSGSIDNTELNQMLSAVRAAGQALFEGTSGDVKVQIVAFSADARSYAQVSDFSAFSAQIAALNPAEGGTRPYSGQTDFTAAIQKTMDVYQPLTGYSNQVVFISDGNPNEQTGSNGNSLTSTTSTAWNNFVDNNHLNVTTVGIGNDININRLQDVDLDGQGSPLTVSGFGQLIDALRSEVVGGDVSGNVLHGNDKIAGTSDDDSYGVDGPGYIKSIVINGVTYTWNGTNNIDASSGPDIAGNMLSGITTGAGGKLSFNFATGVWSYVAPVGIGADVTEHFSYTLVDADGTPDSATLSVTVVDVNLAPSGADATLTLLEDGSRVLTAADFGFSDTDGDSLMAVKITTLPGAGSLVLAGGPALAAGASVSVADINAGKLSFVPGANASGSGYASFTFQVRDNGGTANGGVDLDPSANRITFNVTPVNDAPVLGGMGGSMAYTENANPKVIDGSVTLGDIDSLDFSGGRLTVDFSANGSSGDQLSILTGNNISALGNQNVRYGNTTIGTWSGGTNGVPLVVVFNSAATIAIVQALIQQVAFASSSDNPGILDRTVSFTLDDGDGTAFGGQNLATAYAIVQVNAVNDAPVAMVDRVVSNSTGAVEIPEWAVVWNDSDAEGSPLDVTFVGGGSGGTPGHNPGTGNLGNVTFSDTSGSFTYRSGDENGASSPNSTITVTSDTSGALGNDNTGTDQIVIDASGNGNTLRGGSGKDVLIGGAGDDTLQGNDGNDLLVGGAGSDNLNGGDGDDTAAYYDATSGVNVNLALTGQQNTGGGGLDTLVEIENLLGSKFNDVLTGNSGNNVLAGNGGNDLLSGGGGADTFKWLLGDSGTTTISQFNPGVDKLDLSQLLTGEHSTVGSLDDYLTMAFGADTTITVDSNGTGAGGAGQTIVLQGVNLMTAYAAPDTASVISHMLDDGSLKVDA